MLGSRVSRPICTPECLPLGYLRKGCSRHRLLDTPNPTCEWLRSWGGRWESREWWEEFGEKT